MREMRKKYRIALMTRKKKAHDSTGAKSGRSFAHFFLIATLTFIPLLGGTLLLTNYVVAKEVLPTPPTTVRCVNERAQDFQCRKKHFETTTRVLGPKAALENLKVLYARDPYIVSQCHQLIHSIGNVAAEMYGGNIGEAFTYGDGFCWSGYYHGVVEQALKQFNPDTIATKADSFCADIPGKTQYSFDYFNCVHGLGHGFMAVTKNELFDSLDLCENLSGGWEKESCYGGVYMENVMVDNRTHFSKYLKPDDLMYPCNAVDVPYKAQCYLMQTSYALTKNGRSFANLFELCAGIEEPYRDICAQSIGRDASGQSVSDPQQTHAWCREAKDLRQQEHCIIGAAKDFVSYFHSDKQAYTLCAKETGTVKATCENTVKSYYSIF